MRITFSDDALGDGAPELLFDGWIGRTVEVKLINVGGVILTTSIEALTLKQENGQRVDIPWDLIEEVEYQ